MLRKMFAISMLLAAMLALFAGTALAQGDGNADKGKTLWEANLCKSCHGANGEGKYASPLAGTTRTAEEVIKQARTVSAAAVIKQLRTPFQKMPTFSTTQVSDEQAGQIADYLKSLAAAAPKTLPTAGGQLPWAVFPGVLILIGALVIGVGLTLRASKRA